MTDFSEQKQHVNSEEQQQIILDAYADMIETFKKSKLNYDRRSADLDPKMVDVERKLLLSAGRACIELARLDPLKATKADVLAIYTSHDKRVEPLLQEGREILAGAKAHLASLRR
jgi:hypothetical protein